MPPPADDSLKTEILKLNEESENKSDKNEIILEKVLGTENECEKIKPSIQKWKLRDPK